MDKKMRKFIVWQARFEGPLLVELEAQTPEDAIDPHRHDPDLRLEETSDPFGHGAVVWEICGTDDTIAEVTTDEQRKAYALGCLDFMLEVSG